MKHTWKRLLSVTLSLVLVLGLASPVFAADEAPAKYTVTWEKVENEAPRRLPQAATVPEAASAPLYADSEIVRVSIILDGASTLEQGYSTEGIADNAAASSYRAGLQASQAEVEALISDEVLSGGSLDVVWNLTLAANIISANVPYGKIEAIKALDGVKDVILENRYLPAVVSKGDAEPEMATSGEMIGTNLAWAQGYTGAGSLIAIVDTGLDTEHELFQGDALAYAVSQMENPVTLATADTFADKLDQLNITGSSRIPGAAADDFYLNEKVPFAANYVDNDFDVGHVNDTQEEHGSHVAGIAAANRFVSDGAGGFVPSLETVATQGAAPDAQLIIMKVFGKGGGAYDSDYMAAIEDALVLGADAVNLSLGSGAAGLVTTEYQDIMDKLAASDTVVSISSGNAYDWAAQTYFGYLYSDGANFATDGSPGSYANAFTVASVDNTGSTGPYLEVDGSKIFYSETSGYGNAPIATIAGDYEYVFVDGVGTDEEFAAVADVLDGKIAVCYRGSTSFYQKANAAVANGAVATIIVNNQPGVINMNLANYSYTAPAVSILQEDGELLKTGNAQDAGGVSYYTGSITVGDTVGYKNNDVEYYTMSDFSSWGVPGDLSLKPEITAPGGSIYSVNGYHRSADGTSMVGGHDQYENMSGTSMAAPQIAGLSAVAAQYIRDNDLAARTGKSQRFLIQSLLMSTAEPLIEEDSGSYYAVLKQGAGLADINSLVNARSYLEITGVNGGDASAANADGKVKVELGADPDRTGEYSFSFTINNFSDEDASYNIHAEFFTQDVWSYYGMTMLDTWTAPVQAVVTFDSEDDSASGVSATATAQEVLDYVVKGELPNGADEETFIAENDLDEDGVLTTYDAHLINVASVDAVVPAGESVTVNATVRLLDIADYDDNGAYVEGFVFVDAIDSEDGAEGEHHSFPVLGYYGDWSEPSMTDVGSALEYAYGLEDRPPYLYSVLGTTDVEGFILRSGGAGEDIFLGITPDETYLPERVAVSTTNGDMLKGVQYTQVRNAGASRFTVEAEDGTTLWEALGGSSYAAYYYYNGAAWRNTAYTRNVDLDLASLGLAEGDRFTVSYTLAPEYFVSGGVADWDALSENATMSVSATVDNTAPELSAPSVDADNNLVFSVSDNQYIALVDVMNEAAWNGDSENAWNETASSDPDASAGDTMELSFAIDPEDENLQHFMIQVYDYAMNVTTYKLNLNAGELAGDVTALTVDPAAVTLLRGTSALLSVEAEPWGIDESVTWTSSDETVATVAANGLVTAVGAGTATVTAASVVTPDVTAACEITVVAFDTTAIGGLQDAGGQPLLFSRDLSDVTADWANEGALANDITAMAWDWNTDDGAYFYQQDFSGYMHKVNMDTLETEETSAASTGFGAPVEDFDFPFLTNMFNDTHVAVAVAEGYLLFADDVMENTFDRGYNLASYLRSYSRASQFVAIAWAGFDFDEPEEEGGDPEYYDMFFALDNRGYLWELDWYVTGGLSLGLYQTDLQLSYPAMDETTGNSLVSGDDGNFYLAHYNGSTSELYVLTFDADFGGFVSFRLGDVGDDVWPAALLTVTENETDEGGDEGESLGRTPLAFGEPEQIAALTADDLAEVSAAAPETFADGGLNAAGDYEREIVTVEREDDAGEPLLVEEDQVTLTVKADDVAYNSLITVSYNEVLTLDASSVKALVSLNSVAIDEENRTVTFGYVSPRKLAADTDVLTMGFLLEETDDTQGQITITVTELGEDVGIDDNELVLTIEAVPVAGVSLDEELTIDQGLRLKLTPTFEPANALNKHVTWASDDETIVTVNEAGVIEGIAPGTANVTVTTEDGGFTATCAVTVVGDESSDDDTPSTPVTPIDPGDPEPINPGDPIIPVQPDPQGGDAQPGEEEFPFDDVDPDDWTYEEIKAAYEAGLMNGLDEDTFAPNEEATRATIVEVLWRLEVKPETADPATFDDVDPDAAYADAVAWAHANGIVTGVTDTIFEPDQSITREQFAAIVYRYAQFKGLADVEDESLAAFIDADQVSAYAVKAMAWCVENGIIKGVAEDMLDPLGTATRAQTAAIYNRLSKLFG